MAGDEAGLDGALVQWKAEVRAAIFDRKGGAVMPEHDDGQRAHLREQLPLPLQLFGRPGVDLVLGHGQGSFLEVTPCDNLRGDDFRQVEPRDDETHDCRPVETFRCDRCGPGGGALDDRSRRSPASRCAVRERTGRVAYAPK